MDPKVLDKLYKLGAVDRLPNGQDGVRVSLQYRSRLTSGSRSDRRDLLKQAFEDIAKDIVSDGAEVDLDSISVSGQTVEAILPVTQYDDITDKLNQQNVRVDLVEERQIT